MSVVGFDFGNESCVIAVARRRGIDVLQNEVGNRRTRCMVGYSGKQRLIGDEAVSQYTSNYKNTVTDFKRFLGRKMTDSDLSKELNFIPLATVDISGEVGFSVNYDGKKETIRAEAVTAAMFQKLKATAEAGLDGQRVSDCVIGCPVYFTDVQRRAMLDAANIAGLNVLRLMNETAAVALNYGILRPLPKEEERIVCFVDMGKTCMQCSLVSFTEGKFKTLSKSWDIHLGGRDLDEMLVQHFAKYIKDKYKLDVLSEAKPTMKLRKECERVKRILSANQVVQMNVEYIMNDTDVKGEVKRAEFVEMAEKDFLVRLKTCVQDCITKSGVDVKSIHSCEIIGGATRIPCVQAALAEIFGKEVNKTCDSDESIARGCALQCAMLSPSFRVREFDVQDTHPYAINVQWKVNDKPEEPQTLFDVGNSIPSIKLMSFKRTDKFELTATYRDVDALPPGQNPLIGTFLIDTPAQPASDKTPKIKVKVKLNIHGVLAVSKAEVITELDEPEAAEPEDTPMAEETAAPAAAAEEATKEGEEKPTDAEGDADMKGADATAEGGAEATEGGEQKMEDDKAAAGDKPAVEAKPAEPKKKKVKREEIKIVSTLVGGFNQQTLQELFERENQMALNDKVIQETNEARNSLESYCLEMRSKVQDGALKEYVEEKIKSEFCSKCTDIEDWLYDEGYDAQKSEFKKRMEELRKVGDAAEKRLYEDSHRDEFIAALKKEIGHWSQLAASTDEKYAHIEAEEKTKVTTACNDADQWLAGELTKLDKVAKHQDPSLTIDMLRNKVGSLADTSSKIMNKPKPKPKPKEPEPKPESETAPMEEDTKEGEPKEEGEGAPKTEGEGAAKAEDAPPGMAEGKPAEGKGEEEAASAGSEKMETD